MGAAQASALKFPWANNKSFVDAGGAQGCVPVQIALAHSHLAGDNSDLPVVGPIFEEYVQSFGLEERLSSYPGDFFKDFLPSADVIIPMHLRLPYVQIWPTLHLDFSGSTPLALYSWPHETSPEALARNVAGLQIVREFREPMMAIARA